MINHLVLLVLGVGMDRVCVSHQVGLVVEELPTDWTGQLGGSVQAGVLPQGGCHIQFNISDKNRKSFTSRGEKISAVRTLNFRDFLVVSFLYVIV